MATVYTKVNHNLTNEQSVIGIAIRKIVFPFQIDYNQNYKFLCNVITFINSKFGCIILS